MVVEDNEHIRKMLQQLLETMGYEVLSYSTNLESLMWDTVWRGVDVALVDIRLGEQIDGADILRYLKVYHPQVKRVAVTALPEVPSDLDATVVQKPFDLKVLLEVLKT